MRALILVLPIGIAGCGSTDVGDPQGPWAGTITCFTGQSDLAIGLTVANDSINGSGQIRDNSSNINYTAIGTQSVVDRLSECASTPLCAGTPDCAKALDKDGQAGHSVCLQGLCSPCFERSQQRQVTITLQHQNPTIPYPRLELWRFGTSLMEGTIKLFCADEDRLTPKVTVSKQ